MEKFEFKRMLNIVLKEYGFVNNKRFSKLETDEMIVFVSTQKSNFDNVYFINYGFSIKILNIDIVDPNENQCDVSGRFVLDKHHQSNGSINYKNIKSDVFCDLLRKELEKKIVPVVSSGISKYFKLFPTAIKTATLKLKKHLSVL